MRRKKSVTVFCHCGGKQKEMINTLYEVDQDEVFVQFLCEACGKFFMGKIIKS